MKTLHLVTVKWAHVEDTVRWESVCLCQACLFDLIPLQKIINQSAPLNAGQAQQTQRLPAMPRATVQAHFLPKFTKC